MHILGLAIGAACLPLVFLTVARSRGWRSPARWLALSVAVAGGMTFSAVAAQGELALLLFRLLALAVLFAAYAWARREHA